MPEKSKKKNNKNKIKFRKTKKKELQKRLFSVEWTDGEIIRFWPKL